MNKKKLLVIFIIIILTNTLAFLLYHFIIKDMLVDTEIQLVDHLEVEINSEVELYSFIKNKDDLKLKTENYLLDTKSLGNQKINITYLNKKREENYQFTVTVVDTLPPEIECEEEILGTLGKNIDLLKKIKVTDNSKEEVTTRIEGNYDINKEGEYALKIIATDSSKNKAQKDFTLKVVKNAYDYEKIVEPSGEKIHVGISKKGKEIYTIDGNYYIDGYLIVNKTYPLNSGFVPTDTYKSAIGINSQCQTCINKTAYEAWLDMKRDASAIGLNIWIQSGYRPFTQQVTLYNQYVNRDGKENADTYSSRPGHSEHQSGLCFDLNTITDSFASTMEGKWINENASRYGFVIRFPKGKESETGYKYESWHLRYVGSELSNRLYNNGNWISLENYFGITSSYES